MQPSPLATIASPTGSLQDRLARVNRGNSGITAGMGANGTPFLTNRPEYVDELPDEVVNQVVSGGELNEGGTSVRDPRALLKAMIVGNDNRGMGHAAELASREPMQDEAVRQRVAAQQGAFSREQKMLDTNAEADAYFLPQVQRMNRYKTADALEALEAKTAGERMKAMVDQYGHELDYDANVYKADRDYQGAALRGLTGAYGDAEMAGQISKPARDGASILRTLIQSLIEQGALNAPR